MSLAFIGGSFLVDPAQAVSVALGVVGVLTHGEVDPLRLLPGIHGPGPGGDAQRQVVRGHVEGLGHQGLGADDGACPDDRAVEDDGPRAHETAVLDRAALKVGVVADDAVVSDHGGPLLGGVHDGAVLDRRALADDDLPEVRPKHRAGPDRRLCADPDVADDHRVGVDVGVRVDLRHE
jgi:hypothetical protein